MKNLGNGKTLKNNKVYFGNTRVVKPDPVTVIFTRFNINENNCWIWTGSVHRDGYAKHDIKGKTVQVHRFLYETFYGPIKKGLLYCHKCDVKLCINPAHAFIGTHQDNATDMVQKGRSMIGEKNNRSKLKTNDIIEIKKMNKSGIKGIEIAKKFNVSKHAIYRIINGLYWKHVKE